MKKRGFTLTELIGVLTLLGVIFLIIIPVVDGIIKKGKQDLYNSAIDSIKLSLQDWFTEQNIILDEGENITITLSQLKQADFVDKQVTNPKTEELFPNDMLLNVMKENGLIVYNVQDDTGTNKDNFLDLPIIEIHDNLLDRVTLDSSNTSTYTDRGAMAKDKNGNALEVTTEVTPEFDITKKGVYLYTYTATSEGHTNKVIKTVLVKDTEAPMISFTNDIAIEITEINSYDFLADVTVTDNSGEVIVPTVETNFSTLEGIYTIKYIARDSSGNETIKLRKIQVGNICGVAPGTQFNFAYTGSVQSFVPECAGRYKLEVWGAQGGDGGPSNKGGKGGYSYGILNINDSTNLFIYVGGAGKGSSSTSASTTELKGGFNGGGSSYQTTGSRGSGGGSTDIRINQDSLYARVIVAGGGGGNLYHQGNSYKAGAGGGTTGGNGDVGIGATQVAAGTGYKDYTIGGFGYGGYRPSSNTSTVCGGGGGWYGGGSGNGAGGGSGWIYTASSFSTWQSGNASDASKWLLNSNYYLTDASTVAGNTSFTDPDGTTVTGHASNGYARITYLGN